MFINNSKIVSGVKAKTIPPFSSFSRFQDQTGTTSAEGSGKSVAISGDGLWAISGAPTGASNNGRVYVANYNGSSWTETQVLSPSESGAINFGREVAIDSSGQHMIISAEGDDLGDTNAGALYYFTESGGTWTQQQRFTVSDPQTNAFVGGKAITMSDNGDVIAVNGGGADAIYVFTRSGSTWTQQQKISNPGNSVVGVGDALALSGDGTRLAIGNPRDTVSAQPQAGAVFIYSESGGTWTQEDTFTDSVAIAGGGFGGSLSMDTDGDTLLVAAERTVAGLAGSGAGYIYTRSVTTWSEAEKIDNPDPSDISFLTVEDAKVSINGAGNQFLLSAFNKTNSVNSQANTGAVYVYIRDGGTSELVNELLPSHPFNNQPRGNSYFGNGVAIAKSANAVVIGAANEAQDDLSPSNYGAYYLFN